MARGPTPRVAMNATTTRVSRRASSIDSTPTTPSAVAAAACSQAKSIHSRTKAAAHTASTTGGRHRRFRSAIVIGRTARRVEPGPPRRSGGFRQQRLDQPRPERGAVGKGGVVEVVAGGVDHPAALVAGAVADVDVRSEEHTSELQSLMSSSYAVCCLKKKN